MKICDTISFRGEVFPIVGIDGIRGYDSLRYIAGEGLEAALDPGICNEEVDAVAADNLIFYYVPDEMLERSEEEIRRYINDNIV